MAVVYRHRRGDTGEVFYVGIGRRRERAYSNKSRNRHWHRIVSNVEYEVDVLIEGASWEQAVEVEIGLIASYGRRDLGTGSLVNLTNGGDGQLGTVRSEERRKQQSDRMTGEKNPMYRKNHSEDTRQKISEAGKGRKLPTFTEEYRQKISEAKKGKKRPDLAARNKLNVGKKLKKKPTAQVECPHCSLVGGANNMKRWHFNNCKNTKTP